MSTGDHLQPKGATKKLTKQQKRMRAVVAKMQSYVATYSEQAHFDTYTDKTFLDEWLRAFQAGTAGAPEVTDQRPSKSHPPGSCLIGGDCDHVEQRPSKFNDVPHLVDWTGMGGSPFEVARVYPSTGTVIGIRECDLNVEGARALRDWLNKVIP